MPDGDAFPTGEELVEAAAALEGLGRTAARRVRRLGDRAARRSVRAALTAAWRCGQALREAEPGSVAARRALRESLDLQREVVTSLGDDPLAGLDPALGRARAPLRLVIELLEPPEPLRIAWPIRYDLDAIYRLGRISSEAYRLATRLDAVAEELERRARASAAGLPDAGRQRELTVDEEEMELARTRKAQKPAGGEWGGR